ncbi:MAG: hypothetical protein KA248_04560 [Kiritimatiellae bacterium]|nr:hypothetical protein [Kiritimatiellia bacterium]
MAMLDAESYPVPRRYLSPSAQIYPFHFNRKRLQLWHKKSLPFSFSMAIISLNHSGRALGGNSSFSVFACSAFGAPFLHDFNPFHKSFDHPTPGV